jgi:hypothetical protein
MVHNNVYTVKYLSPYVYNKWPPLNFISQFWFFKIILKRPHCILKIKLKYLLSMIPWNINSEFVSIELKYYIFKGNKSAVLEVLPGGSDIYIEIFFVSYFGFIKW